MKRPVNQLPNRFYILPGMKPESACSQPCFASTIGVLPRDQLSRDQLSQNLLPIDQFPTGSTPLYQLPTKSAVNLCMTTCTNEWVHLRSRLWHTSFSIKVHRQSLLPLLSIRELQVLVASLCRTKPFLHRVFEQTEPY